MAQILPRSRMLGEPGCGSAKSDLYFRSSICCRRSMQDPTLISLSILRERTARETGPTSLRLSACSGWRNACTTGLLREVGPVSRAVRSEEHTSELQSHSELVCRPLLETKKQSGPTHQSR